MAAFTTKLLFPPPWPPKKFVWTPKIAPSNRGEGRGDCYRIKTKAKKGIDC